MAHKQVLFRSAAREKVLSGATHIGRCHSRNVGTEIEVGAHCKEMGRAGVARHVSSGRDPQGRHGRARDGHVRQSTQRRNH